MKTRLSLSFLCPTHARENISSRQYAGSTVLYHSIVSLCALPGVMSTYVGKPTYTHTHNEYHHHPSHTQSPLHTTHNLAFQFAHALAMSPTTMPPLLPACRHHRIAVVVVASFVVLDRSVGGVGAAGVRSNVRGYAILEYVCHSCVCVPSQCHTNTHTRRVNFCSRRVKSGNAAKVMKFRLMRAHMPLHEPLAVTVSVTC